MNKLLSLIFGKVKVRIPEESPELQATMDAVIELDKTDPAAANQLLDSYFMREVEADQRRRVELRARASHDVNAAVELRDKLEEDLKANAYARKEWADDVEEPKRSELLAQLSSDDRGLEAELGQLDTTIIRLRLTGGS